MRPRIAVELHVPPDEVFTALEAALKGPDCHCTGWVQAQAAELHVHQQDAHFFSPMLNLWLEEEDDRVWLKGRFGPHPHVWMLFMAIYLVLGFVGVAGLMYGASQWMLDRTPWALGAAPVAAALAAFVYGAAFIGQGLGAEQTHHLWSVVDDVQSAIAIDPPQG